MKTVYYDQGGPRRQQGFRGWSAARWIAEASARQEEASCLGELPISEPLHWALFELGLVDDLQSLPGDGQLDPYAEGTLYAEGLSRAARLLRERAGSLAQRRYDWLCGRQLAPEHVEFRVAVPAERLAVELRALSSFIDSAALQGYAVEMAL